MGRFWLFLGRHRRWSWPILGAMCDWSKWRRGESRCLGWKEHAPKEHGGYM